MPDRSLPAGMVTRSDLHAIARKHGLTPPGTLPVPWTGAASHVYLLGDVVVKVPFDRPDAIQAVTIDAAVAPVAHDLGVQAAELVAFDDSLDIVPVPYAIFHRVGNAAPLDRRGRSDDARETWIEVGRQLSRVHAVRDPDTVPVALRTFRQSPDVDPRPWVGELTDAGTLVAEDAGWLTALLDRLAPAALADVPVTLCHGDVNAANVLVDARSGRLRALIDWAGAGWLDPAWDFAGVPLDVVPWMLEGHRELAPLPEDATAEARILWCQAQMRMFTVRGVADAEDARRQANRHVERVRQYADATGLA